MDHQPQHHYGKHYAAILALLALVFVMLCVALIAEYRELRRENIMNFHASWFAAFHHRMPLGPSDTDMVESWMTFDYINRIFNLPPEYLKASLQIADSHYPRISVSKYAKSQGIMPDQFVTRIQAAIRNYPAAQ